MKLSKARLEPIPETQWSDKVKETLREIKVGQGGVPNIFKTLAHHPDLMRRWLVFGNHVLFKSTLPARERELVILRIGWLCEAEYEWAKRVLHAVEPIVAAHPGRRIACVAHGDVLDCIYRFAMRVTLQEPRK